MVTFVLLTRLSPDALHQPRSFQTLEQHVAEQVRKHCPEARWIMSLALLGPWDYLDVIEVPDMETAVQVSVLVRSHGRAHTEVWPALAWLGFKGLLRGLSTPP